MKMKKKILALLLAATMTIGMGMTTFAAEGNYSITINQIKDATAVHTYEAYQIFTGVFDTETKKLSDVEWGANINLNGGVSYKGNTYTVASELADVLSNETDARDFSLVIASHITGAPQATATEVTAGAGVTLSGLKDGYYLVKDKDGSLNGADDSYTRYIIQIAGTDVATDAKADVPSTEKKVVDTNDSTGETTGWQDSADYDIGDEVPFQFSSTIVSNIAMYVEPYVYTFHDVESAGLTFNPASVSITVGGAAYTDFTVVTNPTDGCTFEIVTGDLRNIAKAGDKVVVNYTATLNNAAVIGKVGNTNKMKLEYSNNPNGEGTGFTPEDTVIVFTYQVRVDKVAESENGAPLVGAEFTLEKYNKAADKWEFVDCVELTEENAETATFTFKGIDDGSYRLAETKTPTGYNTISDEYIYFTVVANHVAVADAPTLESLTGDVVDGLVGSYTFVRELENNDTLATKIVNKSGSILPSTGGIGTTIFYVVGVVCVLGGGAVLFTRKRMSREEI